MMPMYLDYCATTPVDKRVLDTMMDVYLNNVGNADSRTHLYGQNTKHIVETSRRNLADILNVDSSEVLFTSGATESDNTAILGLRDYGLSSKKKHIITTSIEHKAVLESMKVMQRFGFDVDFISPDESGRVCAEDILSKIRDDTLLVSVMHVNNETGIIQPVEEIGDELYRRGIFFHVDAAQSFGKLNKEIRSLKYNMLSISGHKIHGPQGVGALVLRRRDYKRPPLTPLIYGGQQEYGFRPGTTPVALVAGMSKAAEIMDEEYPFIKEELLLQKKRILNELMNAGCGYRVNGNQTYALPNILNISFKGVDSESVFAALKENYAISNGSACTSNNYTPSYVLKAMGFDNDRINEALRISWWREQIEMTALIDYVNSTAME